MAGVRGGRDGRRFHRRRGGDGRLARLGRDHRPDQDVVERADRPRRADRDPAARPVRHRRGDQPQPGLRSAHRLRCRRVHPGGRCAGGTVPDPGRPRGAADRHRPDRRGLRPAPGSSATVGQPVALRLPERPVSGVDPAGTSLGGDGGTGNRAPCRGRHRVRRAETALCCRRGRP